MEKGDKDIKIWGLVVILMVVVSAFSWAAGANVAADNYDWKSVEPGNIMASLNATKPNEVTNLSWVDRIHNEIHRDVNGNNTNGEDVTYDNVFIIRKSDVTPLDANNNRIEDSLELKARNVSVSKVDAIVLYNRSVDLDVIDYSPIGAEIKYDYSVINASAITMPSSRLYELPKIQNVKMVYEDHEVHAYLNSSVPVIKANTARTAYNVTGSNVTIAVIDTGIDDAHESLDDMDDNPATNDPKVIGFKDFVNIYPDPYDDHGHGTHCAGIAAGTGGSSVYKGVAPGANLVGIKVLNAWGSGSESTVIAGIDWAVQNKDEYDIKIISMSFGRDYNNDGTTPMALACDAAVDSGIVVSVAAGNAGMWGSKTVGDPACAKKVVTVGAIDDDMDIAYFSSRGPTADGRIKPEVCAVGVDVTSVEADTGNDYISHSGTSMSTPHVAGVAALMLEYDPNLEPLEVREILMDTAIDRGVIGPDNDYGWGVVDAMFALPMVIPQEHDIKVGLPFIPEYVKINKSIPINSTVFNKGLNNETNVIIDLLVDGTILDSKTIPFIQNGTDTTISFNWTPTTVGWYNVSVYAEPVPGEDYVVNNLATRYVEVPKAVLTDVYADYGIDLDGDGLYNYLAIDVGVNVAEAGYYYLYGDIETLSGFYITDAKNDTYLSVGKQNITLLFNGIDIHRIDLNGPYTLSNLRLGDNYWNTLDRRLNAYNTSFYDSKEFQLPKAMFTDVYNDSGVDTDNDGYYNYLSMDIGVNLSESGYYHWYGELYDSYGDCIAYEGNSTYLESGTQMTKLNFKGPEIYMHSVDGPYYLKYLRLYDADHVKQDSRHDAYTTSAYNYMEFRPPAIFTDVYSDYGEDTDGDDLYNYLVIGVGVNVTKEGRYQVSGSLYESFLISIPPIPPRIIPKYQNEGYQVSGELNENAYYDEDSASAEKSVKVSATTPPAGGGGGGGAPPALIDWDSNRTYLDAGIHNITLRFDRIYNTGYNGSFRTWLRLYETEEWIEIDEAEYFTKNYNYTDFQKPPPVSVTRDLPDAVSPGEEFEVSLTQSGFYLNIGTVTETLPEGFKFRRVLSGGKLYEYDETTNELTIDFDGGATTLIYRVEAGTKEQIENAVFSGTWASVDKDLKKIYGDIGGDTTLEFVEPTPIFDTGSGTYPSISGTHNGTIKPNKTITVSKLYTYPCAGTGGHTESARIWNNSGLNATAIWNGYTRDWHNLIFSKTFVLYKNKTYNYTIRTGSYPQIIHRQKHTTLDGSLITCEEFMDSNGKKYNDWIPAIRLWA